MFFKSINKNVYTTHMIKEHLTIWDWIRRNSYFLWPNFEEITVLSNFFNILVKIDNNFLLRLFRRKMISQKWFRHFQIFSGGENNS